MSNQWSPSHAWSAPGTYEVRLTAYNDSHPQGDGRRLSVPASRPLLDSLSSAGGVHGVVAAAWNGQVVDFMKPVPGNAVLTLVPADSPDGLRVVRHSTAHLMAAAVQALFPQAKFAIGPAIADGFY